MRCSIEHVRIAWVHDNISYPRMLANVENLGPAFAAVLRLEEPPLFARSPQRAESRDVHDVGIFRVDEHLADMVKGTTRIADTVP